MGGLSLYQIVVTIFTVLAPLIFLFPLHKQEPMEKRFVLSFLGAMVTAFAMEILLPNGLWWGLLKQAGYLFILGAPIYCCAVIRKGAASYVAVWSLVLSRFVESLWFACRVFFSLDEIRMFPVELLLILLYLLSYTITFLVARRMPKHGTYEIGPRQLFSALLFWVIIEFFTYSLLYGTPKTENRSYYVAAVVLAEFYCITLLYLQTELFKKSALEKELLTMNLLWKQQKEQYRLTKENIDLINQKCHDLKHQVNALRRMEDSESKDKYLKELEQSVQIYDAIVKTGNEVLDTILTEKSLLCEAKGIYISCVVDGASLSFMDPVDLYAILGNALDNAIEGVSNIKEQQKRLIDLTIYTKGQILVINISNPIEGQLQFRNGLPVTTKTDKGYHGFGLRSIRHNVQRYNGYMTVNTEGEIFELKLIIPIPKKEKEA